MLWFISSIKLLLEVGLLALLGRGVLRLWLVRLHPQHIQNNAFLRLLDVLSSPWLWLAEYISPKVVLPTLRAWLAFFILIAFWVCTTLAKIYLCLQRGLELCQ